MPPAYNYDPYTGQPLRGQRTWLGNEYPQRGLQTPQDGAQPPERTQTRQNVVCRPVASYDEAKAIPTDFSGALTIMPDWAHGHIYVKALADNGNPVFRSYREEPVPAPVPQPAVEYAPLSELEGLKADVEALRRELTEAKAQPKEAPEKPAGKGSK